MALNTKINTYHASLVAGLLAKLKATPEGDGNMLDHALMLYGAGLGNGDQHSPRDLPLVVLGGANGQHVGRGHLRAQRDTPMMNLGLSMLDKEGANFVDALPFVVRLDDERLRRAWLGNPYAWWGRLAGIDEAGATEVLRFVPTEEAVMEKVVSLYGYRKGE